MAHGQQADKADVEIVVDVLRACTNLITAFSMGAKRCRVSTDVGEARELARSMDAILIGERDSQKIDGFDYRQRIITSPGGPPPSCPEAVRWIVPLNKP